MKIITLALAILLFTASGFAQSRKTILSSMESEVLATQITDLDPEKVLDTTILNDVPEDGVVCRRVGTSFVFKCCDTRGVCWIE